MSSPTYGLDSKSATDLVNTIQQIANSGVGILVLSVSEYEIENISNTLYNLTSGELKLIRK